MTKTLQTPAYVRVRLCVFFLGFSRPDAINESEHIEINNDLHFDDFLSYQHKIVIKGKRTSI